MALVIPSACTCPATRQQLLPAIHASKYQIAAGGNSKWIVVQPYNKHTASHRGWPTPPWTACHCPPATGNLSNIHSTAPSSVPTVSVSHTHSTPGSFAFSCVPYTLCICTSNTQQRQSCALHTSCIQHATTLCSHSLHIKTTLHHSHTMQV